MMNERCELRRSLLEDGARVESEMWNVGPGLVRAPLDMLDVGGTSVVRHIMPLIQCISGRQQLARESQPTLSPSNVPVLFHHS